MKVNYYYPIYVYIYIYRVLNYTDYIYYIAGWEYSLKFHGAVWHGNYKHFRSFVRRRRWIRLRRRLFQLGELKQQKKVDGATIKLVDDITTINKKPASSPLSMYNNNNKPSSPSSAPSSSSITSQEELINTLSQCRLDRERLVIFDKALSTIPNASKQLFSLDLLNVFNFERTKCIVLRVNNDINPISFYIHE